MAIRRKYGERLKSFDIYIPSGIGISIGSTKGAAVFGFGNTEIANDEPLPIIQTRKNLASDDADETSQSHHPSKAIFKSA